jgi:hypothetical protein
MGILAALKKIFGKKRRFEALEAPIESASNRFKSIESIQSPEKPKIPVPQALPEAQETKSIELQKDSMQLGVAAGYTGRSIRGIESSLSRIETQMITKDWFLSKFEDQGPEIVELLKEHEENQEKRFEILQNLINSIQKTAKKAPEPVKTELLGKIEAVKKQLPLTPKMRKLISITKARVEISYADLATELGISVSALRGLLTNTIRRTDKVKRFSRQGKGWVKYTEKTI